LSRGVFRQGDAPEAPHPELLGIALRVPHAVVCLVSAAALHDLTDELPRAAQIAVPCGMRSPRITYPPIEVFHFDAATFDLGLEFYEAVTGEPVRVYSAARWARCGDTCTSGVLGRDCWWNWHVPSTCWVRCARRSMSWRPR